ncbi:MAG: hypothetical protein IAG13_04520, partial [Deltaproteobacteria bacterium]|nr:hypothetical protein [Nannocystaceae bacterium]
MRTLAEPRDLLALAALCAGLLGPATAQAHFVLTSPPAAHEQDGLGDPQKAPPCGDNGASVATGIVTAFQGGDTVTITIDETIYHPGHYRVALAINDPSELPPEPVVTPGDTPCGTTEIMDPAVFPVLADGVWPHTDGFGEPQTIDIVLPDDISCTNCTLQVIQFMSDHGLNTPGGCFYHHCAMISIEPGAAEGLTTTPAEDSGSEGGDESSTGATSVTTAATNGDDTAEDTSDDAADASASATAAVVAATTTA